MLKVRDIRFMCFATIFFILCFFNFYVCAQSLDESIKMADELYKLGDFNKSSQLYKRVLYFNKKSNPNIYKKTGDCYFYLNDFKSALNYYDSSLIRCNSQILFNEIIVKKTDCLIFLKDFEKSLLTIEELKISDENESRHKKNFYKGMIYFALADFEKSELFFLEAPNDTSGFKKNQIVKLFENKRYLESPNPKLAGTLSSIIPGLGQLYAGDNIDALNSFLLVSFFITVSVDMSVRYGLPDALISIAPWLNRYFKGGYENAEQSARRNRDIKRNKILNQILDIVDDN